MGKLSCTATRGGVFFLVFAMKTSPLLNIIFEEETEMKKFVLAILVTMMTIGFIGLAESAWRQEWPIDTRVSCSEWTEEDMYGARSYDITIEGGYVIHVDMEEINGVPDGIINVFKDDKWLMTGYFIDEQEYADWTTSIIKQCLEGKTEIMV